MNKNNSKSAASDASTPVLPSLEARVKLYRSETGQNQLMGFADLIIGGAFVIRGLRILRKTDEEGAFVAFPSRRGTGEQQDKYFEVAHPITAEARAAVAEIVIEGFKEATAAATAN
jgi:DNA-binding cell septation regulator SpoVG